MAFKEAHTAHATREEADDQIKEGIEIYKEFFDALFIPYIILQTPSWDTFSGAEYNYDFFALMPDKRAIELGSGINLGDKFAKAYDITYQDKEGKHHHVYQTCYGISERTLGVALSIHGDDSGLIFPSSLAPIQVIIVPIIMKGKGQLVLNYGKNLFERLKKSKIRCKIDDSDKKPGDKYYFWEMKGVPVRIEIGPREAENERATLVKRTDKSKTIVDKKDLIDTVNILLNEIDGVIYSKANEFLKANIFVHDDKAEQQGIIKVPWCEIDSCGLKIEEDFRVEALGYDPEEKLKDVKCLICGKTAKSYLYVGKKY